jgi:hypothetical protein
MAGTVGPNMPPHSIPDGAVNRVEMSRHFRISGQFILSIGTFVAVILSFTAAALLVGPGGRFVSVIVLFLALFAALYIPLSILARPLIERDAITAYLDGVEKKLAGWAFKEEDLANLRRLEAALFKKKGRDRFVTLAARASFLIAEMERLEKARASFYWDEREGMMH